MPFDTPPWGGKFGMLTDRFGIDWMIAVNPRSLRARRHGRPRL